jgi:hypothetical protein
MQLQNNKSDKTLDCICKKIGKMLIYQLLVLKIDSPSCMMLEATVEAAAEDQCSHD